MIVSAAEWEFYWSQAINRGVDPIPNCQYVYYDDIMTYKQKCFNYECQCDNLSAQWVLVAHYVVLLHPVAFLPKSHFVNKHTQLTLMLFVA